jgi:DNA-binding response OmpR family regulator
LNPHRGGKTLPQLFSDAGVDCLLVLWFDVAMASGKNLKDRFLFVGRPTLDFELMQTHVAQFGFTCLQVPSAVEALDALDSEHFDLIIVDDTLPERSALELISMLDQGYANTPLMLLGSLAAEAERLAEFGHRPLLRSLAKPLSLLELDHVLTARLACARSDGMSAAVS